MVLTLLVVFADSDFSVPLSLFFLLSVSVIPHILPHTVPNSPL